MGALLSKPNENIHFSKIESTMKEELMILYLLNKFGDQVIYTSTFLYGGVLASKSYIKGNAANRL